MKNRDKIIAARFRALFNLAKTRRLTSHDHTLPNIDKQSRLRFRSVVTIAGTIFILITLLLALDVAQNEERLGFSHTLTQFPLASLPAQAEGPASGGKAVYLPIIDKVPTLTSGYSIVFVSRQIPPKGSIYYQEGGALPGQGPFTRFTVAAPGQLIIREASGTLRTLIDGSNPKSASLNLIDVNAPDVSYDGTKIVFAGLPNGVYEAGYRPNPGGWRIYVINVDGTGLRQVTFSDQDNLDLSQFNNEPHWKKYDDTDPVWLPDGRIVFSSTRWPSKGMYQDARTTNLYVVNADGSNLHRITAERNGADRPLVDPLTGKIVYTRWWRNFRNATNNMGTITDPLGGYRQHLGLVAESQQGELGAVPGADLTRNSWQLATVNPDGTGLAQWAGVSGIGYASFSNQAYGGSFAPDGSLYTSFFPQYNLTEASGFGGIRRFQRGPNGYSPIVGITDENNRELVRSGAFHVFKGNYAAEPEVLPDGRVIISWAADTRQDYGLYIVNEDGSELTPLYDNPGTTELRSRLIRSRPIPPIISDQVTRVASLLPPLAAGPYDIDGTFTFDDLNVYFNAPVDMANIADAMPVGSAATIRFFIDHQRSPGPGFAERMDWPILLQEVPVNPDGSVEATSPANVPLFEQIRSAQPQYTVPLAGEVIGPQHGAAHVAGLNFGRPGDVQKCVGCHAGHSMIPVPDNPDDALWTNLAPGATVTVSSVHPDLSNGEGLTDRVAQTGSGIQRHWLSNPNQNPNSQWVQLTFPVPVTVRTVRLYNRPEGTVQVNNSTVKLFSDAAATNQVAIKTSGSLSKSGTDVNFSNVKVRVVRIEINNVTGTYRDQAVAGLAEVEVIARGEAGP